MGSDIFIVCSPGRNSVFVADPEATTQITTRRNDFPKPIEIYGSVDLFGKNVVSTEGSIWRHHRKITSPPFTEKNNHLVWQESLHQAQSMMASFLDKNAEKGTVSDIAAATMRLSLHVISRAGFGRRLLWPHEELEQDGQAGVVPEGHTMTYKDSLSTLLENIIAVMLLPKWFLGKSLIHSDCVVKTNRVTKQTHRSRRTKSLMNRSPNGASTCGKCTKKRKPRSEQAKSMKAWISWGLS
jgi:hypothetical protein